MKLFKMKELRESIQYSISGGQALHLHNFCTDSAPLCFKRSKELGHLFDQNKERLIETAKKLGVKKIVIHGEGDKMHVDLCGMPLKRCKNICEK